MLRKANNVLELVGQTPIVRLNRLNPHPQVESYVKLEYFNPGGSVKDRPALAMIEAVVGQLYLVLQVSLLVGLRVSEVAARSREKNYPELFTKSA